jgi:hypothetical protein
LKPWRKGTSFSGLEAHSLCQWRRCKLLPNETLFNVGKYLLL